MATLRHTPLMELTLDVDFAATRVVGDTPRGLRRVTPVNGGSFRGERLSGAVLPGADWVINRPDGVMAIDVRLLLQEESGALIYLSYEGRFIADADAMKRFRAGALLDERDYSLVVVARLECGDPRFAWLNNVVAVGAGVQLKTGVRYAFHEIG